MTRIALIKALIVALWLSGCVGLAEDQPQDNSAASTAKMGSVEAAKAPRVRVGGISLTGGYNRFSGPAHWGPPFFGYYDSQFWTPFWQSHFPYGVAAFSGFYPAYNFQRGPNMGEIRLQAEPATASLFINDAYAGRVQDLRSISLEPGVYSLRIETEGRPAFSRRVYVLSGKTLNIEANLMAAKGEPQP